MDMLFLLMGSISTYICQKYSELYSEKGGKVHGKEYSAYIYAFCMCTIDYRPDDRKYTTAMYSEGLGRKDEAEEDLRRIFYFCSEHKGVEGEGKGWKRYRHFSPP